MDFLQFSKGFNEVSKIIGISSGFVFLRSVIGWENSRQFLNQ